MRILVISDTVLRDFELRLPTKSPSRTSEIPIIPDTGATTLQNPSSISAFVFADLAAFTLPAAAFTAAVAASRSLLLKAFDSTSGTTLAKSFFARVSSDVASASLPSASETFA